MVTDVRMKIHLIVPNVGLIIPLIILYLKIKFTENKSIKKIRDV
jgi:hypothetical protein